MFLRNCWYVAEWSHALKPGEVIARTMLNEPLALYRGNDGTVVAFEDRCCHRLAPLSLGRVEGDNLRCMYHGLKFAPSGKCIEIPGQEKIPDKVKVRSYPVAERDGWIWIWMGDPARADEDEISRVIGPDRPEWRLDCGELEYAANYQLIHDNLLDLSHLSYVHAATFGHDTPQWAELRPKITPIERGVHVARWIADKPASPYLRLPEGTRMDLWSEYTFVVPGIFMLVTEFCPAGTAERLEFAKPGPEEAVFVSPTGQAVTPITGDTTIYRFTGGGRRADVDDQMIEAIMSYFMKAFYEDRAMIEAQQKVIARSPNSEMVSTSFDGGVTVFRKLLGDLIAEEANPTRLAG